MTDGLCPKCGAPLVRQTDRRKPRGYSLRCSVGGHSGGAATVRRKQRPRGLVRTQKLRRGRRPVATLAPYSGPPIHLYFD